MAAKSKLEKYKVEISDLISKGMSIRSAWKFFMYDLSEEEKISYDAFLHFVNRHIKSKSK